MQKNSQKLLGLSKQRKTAADRPAVAGGEGPKWRFSGRDYRFLKHWAQWRLIHQTKDSIRYEPEIKVELSPPIKYFFEVSCSQVLNTRIIVAYDFILNIVFYSSFS